MDNDELLVLSGAISAVSAVEAAVAHRAEVLRLQCAKDLVLVGVLRTRRTALRRSLVPERDHTPWCYMIRQA